MKICKVDSCERRMKAKGLCIMHYNRFLIYGDLGAIPKRTESRIIVKEDYALVELQNSEYAIIDLDDIDKVKGVVWYKMNEGYAYNAKIKMLLHQRIVGKAPEGMEIDHENRNRLDCRKKNLRHISKSGNKLNSQRHDESIGVRKRVSSNGSVTWQAYTAVDGKMVHIGTYLYESEAIAARKTSVEEKRRIENEVNAVRFG